MKKLLDLITNEVTEAFVIAGYDGKYGRVTLSNRPDLCEYQCNGAMAAAKEYKCAPFMISDKIAETLHALSQKNKKEIKETRDAALSLADLADWEHFICHYEEAYSIALHRSIERLSKDNSSNK